VACSAAAQLLARSELFSLEMCSSYMQHSY
jgi:hypothetical protein